MIDGCNHFITHIKFAMHNHALAILDELSEVWKMLFSRADRRNRDKLKVRSVAN